MPISMPVRLAICMPIGMPVRLPINRPVRLGLPLPSQLLRLRPLPFRPVPHVPRPQRAVPEREEGLRKVRLDAPRLVVDVVVGGVITRYVLHGVPWKRVPAVVVNGLDGREAEEEGALADRHVCKQVSDAGAERVEEKALNGVVVESAVGVGDVEAVVARVEGGCRGC